MNSLSYPPEQALEPQPTLDSDVDEPESNIDEPYSHVILGPRLPDVKPLGHTIRICINLKGFRGLDAQNKISLGGFETPGRHSYYAQFASVTQPTPDSFYVNSSSALEGEALFQGIVQWNETLWIDCPELSYIHISVWSGREEDMGHEVSCWIIGQKPLHSQDESCLVYTASSVILSDGEHTLTKYYTDPIIHHEWSELVSNGPAGVLLATLHQLPHFLKLIGLLTDECGFMAYIYMTYQMLLTPQSCYDSRIDKWQSVIMKTMDAVMRAPQERIQCRREDAQSLVARLADAAHCLYILLNGFSEPIDYGYMHISELARLVHIITAPDPATGTASVSANTNQHAISRGIVKDTLLIALEAIVQSSDAFPPLKSAASGLLLIATYADMASSNKKQIREIYKRVDGLVDSLKHGMFNGASLSPAHQAIIDTLAKDIAALQQDMEDIVNERKGRFKRYFRAKRNREELQDVMWQLDNVRANYTAAVATLNATTITEVRDHVKAITLVLNARHIPALGTRRVDDTMFPFNVARIEEA